MEKEKEKLEIAPDCLIFVSLASMYLDNGMIDEAIELCESGLKIEPENEEANLILAKAEIEKGNKDDAKKRLFELINKNPDNSSARELIRQIEPQFQEKTKEVGEKGFIAAEEEKRVPLPKKIDTSFKELEKEEATFGEKTEDELEEQGKLEKFLIEKINKIIQIEGVINCFFRLKSGLVIKHPQLVGSVDDLFPLLDSLLASVKTAADVLKMGKLEVMLIEIDKGVFYIFETEDYDCFLLSRSSGNFGLLKAILPRILGRISNGDVEE